MVYNARAMALLLAVVIALVMTLFQSLVENTDWKVTILAALVSFFASYISIYLLLELFVFRQIEKIYKILGKDWKKERDDQTTETSNSLNRMHGEFYSFALQKQKEIDELRKLEAFRRDFVANVSHELKTPVFAAQGFIHTLLDGAIKDKSVRVKFLKKAAKNLDGLDRLVQDLLILSQIETGGIKMKLGNVELIALCEEAVDQLQKRAEKKGVTVKLMIPEQEVFAFADEQRISQVVANLLSNAISYTPEGGVVTLSFDIGKKYITFLIEDTGEGIPAEHLPRIFERFYRVDQSRSREKGGTGLGLAIVKHILEGHGTKAEVESIVGKGSLFKFKLSRPE